MRIGIDITPLAKPRSGVPHYCHCLLEHLIPLAPGVEFLGLSTGLEPIASGALPHPIGQRHIPLPTRAMYRVWDVLRRPRADVLLGGVDVFHATNYYLPPVKSARTVVTIHDLAFLARPELCSPKIARIFAKRVPAFMERADAIIACSDSTKRDILQYSNVDAAKVTVVHEAADEDFAPLERTRALERVEAVCGVREPFLLFVSTLEPRKNVAGLLRAFERLAKDVPHTLVLVGAMGWKTGEIVEMLQRPELKERVVHVGFVRERADIAALYSAADAFVFPTLYEGFGLPVLEAMTCGCPVVTSNNTSIPEVAGDAAVFVDAEDEGAIAAAVRHVLEDVALRETLTTRGFEQARKFSWRRCASATLEVYKSLL